MKTSSLRRALRPLSAIGLAACALGASAAQWSDNTIGIDVGNSYGEPGIPGSDIRKTVFTFNHVSGDAWGRNLVEADVLKSSGNDPAAGGGGGAQEFYGFYRRTLSLGHLTGQALRFGPVKDINLVGRADLQTKNNDFAPRARKLIGGLSLDFDVPKGYVESGLYAYSESNHNGLVGSDVRFDTTYMLDTSWMVPFQLGVPAFWRGNIAYVGPKGRDGFHVETKAETRLATALMFEVGNHTGLALGIGYEYWHNKYGNDARLTPGASYHTALLLAEYHF